MLSRRAITLAVLARPLCRSQVQTQSPIRFAAHFSTTVSSLTDDKLHDTDLRPLLPSFSLKNRSYVITGGGRGIGYAATRAIAELGGDVTVLDILPAPVDDFAGLEAEFGVKAQYVRTDVTDEESLRQGFEEAGTVDGCVTAAGIALDKPFLEQSWAEVKRLHDINVLGTFFAAQLATRRMQEKGTGGSIVMIASVCAHVAIPGHRLSAHHASKGAVHMLSKALAVEMAPEGIRFNTISPGYIETDMTRSLREEYPHLVEIMHSAPPMKRIGNRNDLVGAIVYLLSDAAAYTTGTDIAVTGGLHAGRIEP